MAYLPCLNPNCHSHGAPHPNCKCYDNLSSGEQRKFKSQNRLLKSQGEEEYELPGTYKKQKRGNVANSNSILGNDYGPGYADGGEVHFCSSCMPHHPNCEYYAKGGDVEDNNEFHQNPELAVEHAIAQHGLSHLLTKTGSSKSENPHKPIMDFVENSKKGKSKLHAHIKGIFDKKGPEAEVDPKSLPELEQHLDNFKNNPDQMFSIGGSLGNTLPEHAGMIATKAANAMNYLSGLKPMGSQNSPFDKITPPSKIQQRQYQRQLGFAEQPLSVIPHIKAGTVQPADLQTIQSIYPQMAQSLKDRVFDHAADAKQKGEKIPYRSKVGLSSILGPMDSTQTPQAMQAIIQSAGMPQGQPEQGGKKSKNGATAQTQKTMDKTNKLYETQTDSLQMNKKS